VGVRVGDGSDSEAGSVEGSLKGSIEGLGDAEDLTRLGVGRGEATTTFFGEILLFVPLLVGAVERAFLGGMLLFVPLFVGAREIHETVRFSNLPNVHQ